MKRQNPLLHLDVYKMSHMTQYAPGTTKVFSYLCPRSDDKFDTLVFFGLQYYLEKYITQKITRKDAEEFLRVRASILGANEAEVEEKIYALADLGFWPLEIKSVNEGDLVTPKNCVMTITNTIDGFHWCVGFIETLILKVWHPMTVASYSFKMRRMLRDFAEVSCDNLNHLQFQVHDFGARGGSSEETSEIGGMSHLANFLGSDTVTAVVGAEDYYDAQWPIALSVPATEHSVMESWGPDKEYSGFEALLTNNPKGIVSLVSDTYDYWRVLTDYAPKLKPLIMAREGKAVFRPDSGDPVKIVSGWDKLDRERLKYNMPKYELHGSLNTLGDEFGYTVNSKGFKLLDPHVGLIYGDGWTLARMEQLFERMHEDKWAASEIVFGIGGLMIQNHNRDEAGFAIKATWAIINGVETSLFKRPATDLSKSSHMGLLRVERKDDGTWVTHERQTLEQEADTYLTTRFINGEIVNRTTFGEVRDRISAQSGLPLLRLG